ncbi:hypothetical protein BCR41DRAFT_356892, partial [Lobosporangium transversale]
MKLSHSVLSFPFLPSTRRQRFRRQLLRMKSSIQHTLFPPFILSTSSKLCLLLMRAVKALIDTTATITSSMEIADATVPATDCMGPNNTNINNMTCYKNTHIVDTQDPNDDQDYDNGPILCQDQLCVAANFLPLPSPGSGKMSRSSSSDCLIGNYYSLFGSIPSTLSLVTLPRTGLDQLYGICVDAVVAMDNRDSIAESIITQSSDIFVNNNSRNNRWRWRWGVPSLNNNSNTGFMFTRCFGPGGATLYPEMETAPMYQNGPDLPIQRHRDLLDQDLHLAQQQQSVEPEMPPLTLVKAFDQENAQASCACSTAHNE